MPKVTVKIPFMVSNDEIQFSEKAVQLPVYRKEGGRCIACNLPHR